MTNYATQYCATLSQAYPYMLRFGALFARNQEGDYKFTNAHTIEVPSISVTGRVNADRNSMTSLGDRTQAHSNSWTPLALRNHRKWSDFVHPSDIDETNEVLSITKITTVMNQEEKFPEMDRYLISTVFNDWRALGRVPLTGTLTNQNVLHYFDQMMVMMTENNVPDAGRILYVTPKANLALKNAISMYRTGNEAAPANIQRAINSIDSVSVEEVPSSSMKTVYDFTVGSKAGVTAKQIDMFLVHPSAVITPESYESVSLDPPSALTENKWLYYEESYNDVFILPNKQHGIEFFVSGMTEDAASFTTQAGTVAAGDTKVTITAPVGSNVLKDSRYFYAAASGTAPAALAYGELVDDPAWVEWDGTNTTPLTATNGYKMTVLVTDADGRVYAAGSGTVTSKT